MAGRAAEWVSEWRRNNKQQKFISVCIISKALDTFQRTRVKSTHQICSTLWHTQEQSQSEQEEEEWVGGGDKPLQFPLQLQSPIHLPVIASLCDWRAGWRMMVLRVNEMPPTTATDGCWFPISRSHSIDKKEEEEEEFGEKTPIDKAAFDYQTRFLCFKQLHFSTPSQTPTHPTPPPIDSRGHFIKYLFGIPAPDKMDRNLILLQIGICVEERGNRPITFAIRRAIVGP